MSWASDMIEFVLMHAENIENAVQESRLDGGVKGSVGGRGSRMNDPTSSNAIRNAMEIPVVRISYGPKIAGERSTKRVRNPEKWLRMARDVREYYTVCGNDRMKEFFKCRYERCEDWRYTCRTLGISKDVYYAMRADVIRTAELYAVFRGAVAPIDCRI